MIVAPGWTSTTRQSLAADARELARRQQAREVGELARELGARVAAARDDEREQPPPLLRVALDLGQLEHLEQVVPQRAGSRRRPSA